MEPGSSVSRFRHYMGAVSGWQCRDEERGTLTVLVVSEMTSLTCCLISKCLKLIQYRCDFVCWVAGVRRASGAEDALLGRCRGQRRAAGCCQRSVWTRQLMRVFVVGFASLHGRIGLRMGGRLSGVSLSMGACRSCRMLRWEPRPVGVAELTRSAGVADSGEECEGWFLAALFSPFI